MTIEGYVTQVCTDESVLREVAAWIAIWAATDGTMRRSMVTPRGSEIYNLVTLGQAYKGFSSCAYLPHFVLECLGFTDPGIGRHPKADQPLSRLAYHKYSESVKLDDSFLEGDVIQIGSNGDSHVYMCVANSDGRSILGAHYGQEGTQDEI